MATMNPVLRLRRAFRSVAKPEPLSDEQAEAVADEAADAISDYSHSRQESDLRFERMMAEMRRDMSELRREMAEFRTQILLGMLLISALAVGVLSIVIAVFS